MWGVILAIILGTIIVVGTVIWGFSKGKVSKRIPVPMNAEFVFNICKREWTNDYMFGLLTTEGIRKNRNGTSLVKLYPVDIQQALDEDVEEVEKVQIQKFVCSNENIHTISSKRRRFHFILSKNPEDYPEELRNTLLYNMMTNAGIQGYIKSIFGESLRERDRSIAKQVVDMAGGEVSALSHGRMKEQVEKMEKFFKSMAGGENTDEKEKS